MCSILYPKYSIVKSFPLSLACKFTWINNSFLLLSVKKVNNLDLLLFFVNNLKSNTIEGEAQVQESAFKHPSHFDPILVIHHHNTNSSLKFEVGGGWMVVLRLCGIKFNELEFSPLRVRPIAFQHLDLLHHVCLGVVPGPHTPVAASHKLSMLHWPAP